MEAKVGTVKHLTTIEPPCPARSEILPDWAVRLLGWFGHHQRVLPWRSDPSPYRVWISEIMLQQTQVATVTPYFQRFVARFPTLRDLAAADLQDVLKLWEGLGYYSRARNLHKAARFLVDERHGRLPADFHALQKLPGIGSYTAAAIASIAFGRPIPVVDGNVLRVFNRFWAIETDIRLPRARTDLFERLAPVIQACSPPDFNQAIMELGALICRPRNPLCPTCPLAADCLALRDGRTTDLPVKSKPAKVPHHEIAVGVVVRGGRVLIARRREDQMLGGLWEFPGGKQEAGETLNQTTIREVREETGLDVEITQQLCRVRHAYSHFRITLTAYLCRVVSGHARHHRGQPLKWVPLAKLRDYPFPKANLEVLKALQAHHVQPR